LQGITLLFNRYIEVEDQDSSNQVNLNNENSSESRMRSSINACGPRIKRQENEDGRICKLNGIEIENP